ncbi:MAG: NAD-dependent DNA ligase LigA [Desulfuromonadaceae bacterium]|nr:NAD-dependent DNA ligase LigA [Desulfuromonadaceae bacterium]
MKKRWYYITPPPVLALLLFFLISTLCSPVLSFTCPKISILEAKQQMTTLGNEIRYHNRLYYEKAQPAISDAEYDRLFARLVQLEGCFPALVAADSPTRRVGDGVGDGTQKVKHEQPMLSLTSATGPEAVEALLKRVATAGEVTLLVQPKVDGLPVELIYDAGRLVSASTRGDGRFGENVTEQVREIQGIPHRLTGLYPHRVVVRGEIYAALRLLQNYRAGSAEEKYARHPRHVAAGVLKAQKPDPAVVAVLRLFPFELVTTGSVRSDRAALQLLSGWGFPVELEQTQTVKSFADVQAVYRTYLANRDQLPFAMDGIVVKVDDLSLRRRLGEGGRAPFWAAAWKYPPDTARTQVLGINWTVGRTGRRTPIAEVTPVRLGGIQVSRVSLHSAAEIARLDIAAGDQVVIALVGDVIPQVQEVVGRIPRKSVAGSAAREVPESSLDACLRDSPVCRDQFLSKTAYFTSKSGLNIDGLGRGRLQKLVEAGLVTDIPSLYLLKEEAVAAVPGFGMKTARHLTAAIRSASQPDSFQLAAALGVQGVGPKTVQRLARRFSSLDKLLAVEDEQLAALAATDRRAARALRTFFTSPGGQELLVRFRILEIL